MRLSCCVHNFYADFESEPIARLRSNDVNRWAATALPRSVWRGRALRLSSPICTTNESPPRRDAEGLLDGESDGDAIDEREALAEVENELEALVETDGDAERDALRLPDAESDDVRVGVGASEGEPLEEGEGGSGE